MRTHRTISVIAALSLLAGTQAQAQAPASCPKEKLLIGTGGKSGTYSLLFGPLADACSMVCQSNDTQGGWDNLTQMLARRFDGGIVQVDLLDYLSRSEPAIKRSVRSLLSLHGSHLHIFSPVAGVKTTVEKTVQERGIFGTSERTVSATVMVPIRTLSDLRGRRVAAWQSAAVTASIIDERLKLGLEVIEAKTRADGMRMLLNGEVFAFMAMGGKPMDWVEGNPQSQVKPEIDGRILTLVGVERGEIERLGAPYYSEEVTYRSLGAIGIRTISVPNELVINNIQKGPQVAAIEKFKTCFAANLDMIQNTRDMHPSWQSVKIDAPLHWPAYTPPTQ